MGRFKANNGGFVVASDNSPDSGLTIANTVGLFCRLAGHENVYASCVLPSPYGSPEIGEICVWRQSVARSGVRNTLWVQGIPTSLSSLWAMARIPTVLGPVNPFCRPHRQTLSIYIFLYIPLWPKVAQGR
jgi:hypothetical protein